ncbi:glycoside hydrolase family 35 protein [Maribellus luteus]|nr:glycoside hydrolase family 35 protein [Maribellus luteus]
MRSLCSLVLLLLWALQGFSQSESFEIRGDQFYKNGKPYRVFSGSIHYSRIPHQKWKERLHQARAMGLNTICTYVFWNFHEQKDGSFDFTGDRNLRKFIELAGEEGLNVIVRPGPYVCAEWDLGGFPARLLADKNMRLRCLDSPVYVEETEKYIRAVAAEITDLQISSEKPGPIIMFQVENEYGSYGNDHEYISYLEKLFKDVGFDVPFFTSDGPDAKNLHAGTSPTMLPIINFAEDPEKQFNKLAEYRANIPHMSGEWWVGWLTHWGEGNWKNQNEERQKKELKYMLENDKSFNMFMFHGGTNFGFWAGANHFKTYAADITSYDYGAPLTEGGNVTSEFLWMREMLSKYQNKGENRLPKIGAEPKAINIDSIALTKSALLFDQLPVQNMIKSKQTKTMEEIGQDFGFILYKTTLDSWLDGTMTLNEVHDYAWIYLDGKLIGEVNRNKSNWDIQLPDNLERGAELLILVEAMGRNNFGSQLFDSKGITNRVDFNYVFTQMNWEIYPLPMDYEYVSSLEYKKDIVVNNEPSFYRGEFELSEVGDTYLDLRAWGKGVVWVNGHNLGRYWNIGPQYDLYVPDCWLKEGKNEIIIFETSKSDVPKYISGVKTRVSLSKGEIDKNKLDSHNGNVN